MRRFNFLIDPCSIFGIAFKKEYWLWKECRFDRMSPGLKGLHFGQGGMDCISASRDSGHSK